MNDNKPTTCIDQSHNVPMKLPHLNEVNKFECQYKCANTNESCGFYNSECDCIRKKFRIKI